MFSAVRKIMDDEIPIEYTLTIDGDQLKGKGSADFGARSGSGTSRARGRRRISSRPAVERASTAEGRGGDIGRFSEPRKIETEPSTCRMGHDR